MTEIMTGEAHRQGRIEVVCGSMFSGKTEELIRRLRRAKFARQKVEIFKPAIDVKQRKTVKGDRIIIVEPLSLVKDLQFLFKAIDNILNHIL